MRKERLRLQLWAWVIGISFFIPVVGTSQITLDVLGDGLVRSLVGAVYACLGWFFGRAFEQQLHAPGPEPEPIDFGSIVLGLVASAIPFFGLVGGIWLAVNTDVGAWGYLIGPVAAFVGMWVVEWGRRGVEGVWKRRKPQ